MCYFLIHFFLITRLNERGLVNFNKVIKCKCVFLWFFNICTVGQQYKSTADYQQYSKQTFKHICNRTLYIFRLVQSINQSINIFINVSHIKFIYEVKIPEIFCNHSLCTSLHHCNLHCTVQFIYMYRTGRSSVQLGTVQRTSTGKVQYSTFVLSLYIYNIKKQINVCIMFKHFSDKHCAVSLAMTRNNI